MQHHVPGARRAAVVSVLAVGVLGWLPSQVRAQDTPAMVADSVALTDAGTGAFFIVDKIDGRATDNDMLRATERASRGKGGFFTVIEQRRAVPAGRPVKLAVRGQVAKAGPPIITLLSIGSLHSVPGEVEVTLQPGGRYRVKGVIDAYRREVWLEDEATGQVVGAPVVQRADSPADRKAMEGAVHTCCNLRYEGDWISDANWSTELPMIPAGARIKVVDVGRKSADVLIDGRKFRIGLDYARKQLSTEQLVAKLTVKDDPALRIAAMTEPVRAAVRAGRLLRGMTRDEVVVALGPPRADETVSIEDPAWTYRTYKDEPFVVRFGSDGRVAGVEAPEPVLQQVLHAP